MQPHHCNKAQEVRPGIVAMRVGARTHMLAYASICLCSTSGYDAARAARQQGGLSAELFQGPSSCTVVCGLLATCHKHCVQVSWPA
eukprot:1159216-Pelagomonas_calceolata.AAC.5